VKFRIGLSRTYLLSLFAVLLGLLAGAVLMWATGHNPVEGFRYLFRGGLMNIARIGNTMAIATTLILTGLSVAFAFKTGLFNIGASGQMLMGGLAATAVGLTFTWPRPVLLTAMMLAALLAGGLWAAIAGFLKARFNVHEVVATIMLNWIAFWTIYYVIPGYFKGPFLETESRRLPAAAMLRSPWLTRLFSGSFINLGILIALAAVIVVAFILERTTLGYELKAVGYNRHAAEAAGINVNARMVLSMGIAGALAGLAGGAFYAGYAATMQIGILPSQGFDGIAVALLGASSPWGVWVAGLFFGVLHTGKGFMTAMTRIPPEIADTIIATIIYFAATSVLVERYWDSLGRRLTARREQHNDTGEGGK
jgi:general nucleoside transport system permease protein